MNLIPYPGNGLEEYNERIRAGFRAGKWGFALDVWRAGDHLWRSYTEEQGEHQDSWYQRNAPEILNPEYRSGPFGLGGYVGVSERWQIPTRDALTLAVSLPEVHLIACGILATAQMPHKPSTSYVPTHNAMRQRLHHRAEGWEIFNIFDTENGIAIRLIVAEAPEKESGTALYESDLMREGEPLERWQFEGPNINMEDGKQRRIITGQFKRRHQLSGLQAYVNEADPIKYSATFAGTLGRFEIRKVKANAPAPRQGLGGFDAHT